ncbi:tRNA sulfurtransferase [Halovenus marina]|uniref:tRNA sulfurtransferase n=1 Tax=Halovenus marina TaxID=3396621 RepID=UPI003F57FFAC
MHPPGADTVLVRYGEIGIKSQGVLARMEQRLQENLVVMLDDRTLDATVRREHTRLYAETQPARVEAVTDTVTDCPGVVSASPCLRVEPTMDAITDALAATARARGDSGSLAVRARRAGQDSDHPFSSPDIEQKGGTAVCAAIRETGTDPTVDLDNPDTTFHVECRPDEAYVFTEKRDGPGGLPVSTQKPIVTLVSGGIDSPVAAWELLRRGCPVYPLYIDLGEYGGVDHQIRAERTTATLDRYVPGDLRLRVAPGGDGIARIVDEADDFRMLVVRRFMYRIAEAVADDVGAVGIGTGESIGQKSSQTSANIAVTSTVTDLPIHRPLVGTDKSTITQRAKAIGTYEDATIDTGCHRLAPEMPATNPALDAVEASEPDDVAELARDAAEAVAVVDLSE